MLLKKTPEDFVVTEIPIGFLGGDFLIVKVTKKGLNTEDVARIFSKVFGVPRKNIGYAGSKDKNAVTTQYFSLKKVSKERAEGFSHECVSVEVVGTHNVPLSLGDLQGNRFEIVVRELEKPLVAQEVVPNYYGAQRFGRNNVEVGKLLVQKKFKEACELLKISPNNPVEQIKKLPRHVLLLIVHSYQSHLWNELLQKLLENDMVVPELLPLIGFGTELDELEPVVKDVVEELLVREGLTPRDFIIRQLPGISPEGGERKTMIAVADLVLGAFDGGVQKVSFTLPKGSYATVVVDVLSQ